MAIARSLYRFAAAVALAAAGATALAADDHCGEERYFHPDDSYRQNALAAPHAEFAAMQREAKRGNTVGQRNLAVSYESGYLVSACPGKAAHWYRHAAKGGDKVAQEWIKRHDAIAQLAAGPECAGSNCGADIPGAPQTMSLVSDPQGHYFADLTINGMTVRGMIDTGATSIALDEATAAKMGITAAGGHSGIAQTANGNIGIVTKTVPLVKIGPIALDNVEVSIGTSSHIPLIGMSVLRRLRISAAGGQMVLSR